MFWDKAALGYDFFENIYNGDVNKRLVAEVSSMIEENDRVLECACGTGMISKGIAPRCKELVATDFSVGMLKKAKKKLAGLDNVQISEANIMNLNYEDESFDKVVAGNVIHLLDDSEGALKTVIIPTYINKEKTGEPNWFVKLLERLGADFKEEYTFKTYQIFFNDMGFEDAQFKLVDGKMPCAIAVIGR